MIRSRLRPEEQAEPWRRYRTGESMRSISRTLDRSLKAVRRLISASGGRAPKPRRSSARRLSLAEREEISRGGWRLEAVMSDNGPEFGGCECGHTVTADQRQRRTPPRRSPHSWPHLRERHRHGQAMVLRHSRMCRQISERGQPCGTSSRAACVVSHPTARCARPRPQPPVSSQLPALPECCTWRFGW